MSNTENNYAHLTVWTMNGGPVPNGVIKALTESVESILKDADERGDTRLLYNVTVSDPKAGE